MTKLFKAETPTISEPTPVPDAEDPQRVQALKREAARRVQSSGRTANQLTRAGSKETLGA